MQNMTRRQLLTTTALGAAALGIGALAVGATGANSASAMVEYGHDMASCAHNHHALGHRLSTLIADPAVDDTVKNHAIKTAACPDCGTGIAPTGLGLAASTWTTAGWA